MYHQYCTIKIFLTSLILFSCSYSGQGQSGFKKQVITNEFISEGVAVADVNNDGRKDILAGGYWFESPSWKKHIIMPEKKFNPQKEYSNSFLNFSMDVNQDGWMDLIVFDFPGTTVHWFENPKNKNGYWKKYLIDTAAGNESPAFADVDGDGRSELIYGDIHRLQMIISKAPSKKGDTLWQRFAISKTNAAGTGQFSHGLGTGDLNKDGYTDIITREGWWEGNENPFNSLWNFHPANLGEACSQMHVLDVNGDGLNDVMSAAAHFCGIFWHEQMRDTSNGVWSRHVISYQVLQTHASVLKDINGDGYPDFVTGNRNLNWGNSAGKNPGIIGPALLYWFEFTPGKIPYWKAHKIDEESGAGLNLVAEDINGDGKTDIIICNFKGLFLFENMISSKN